MYKNEKKKEKQKKKGNLISMLPCGLKNKEKKKKKKKKKKIGAVGKRNDTHASPSHFFTYFHTTKF
jgi:hypothetical protein